MGREAQASGEMTISLCAAGTAKIVRVEMIKDGEILRRQEPNQETVSVSFRDRGGEGSYYYGKVVQEDGNMAWASPVWVG